MILKADVKKLRETCIAMLWNIQQKREAGLAKFYERSYYKFNYFKLRRELQKSPEDEKELLELLDLDGKWDYKKTQLMYDNQKKSLETLLSACEVSASDTIELSWDEASVLKNGEWFLDDFLNQKDEEKQATTVAEHPSSN